MKKILLLTIFYLIVLNSYSQNNDEFVEIIIVDTLQADAEEIIYTIYCLDYETTDITYKKPVKTAIKETKEETGTEKIRRLIIKSAIDTLPVSPFTFQAEMYGGKYGNSFNLRFTSAEKLKEFLQYINEIKGTTGFISNKTTSKTELLTQQLTTRILKKGLSDATMIANQSGKKLGKILQIKEESFDEQSGGGWTVYPPLSALAQANNSGVSEKIIITRKLVIRYIWE